MSKTLEQVAKESAKNSRMPLTTQGGYIFEEGFIAGAEHVKKEYEEKLRWIPVDELNNPTIPFLGKDKSGKIELFKVANIFYLKALDVVEWRSIL